MSYNFTKINDGVEFAINEQSVCVFANTIIVNQNKLITDSVSINVSEAKNKIIFNLICDSYDIVTLRFDKIKKIEENSYYVEIDGQLIFIECDKATLISNKNLILK